MFIDINWYGIYNAGTSRVIGYTNGVVQTIIFLELLIYNSIFYDLNAYNVNRLNPIAIKRKNMKYFFHNKIVNISPKGVTLFKIS